MDTSRSYVKMCRNAQDLQRSWKPEENDWWHIGARDVIDQIGKIKIYGKEKWTGGEKSYHLPEDIALYGIVWLPRTDQLQKMTGNICEKNFLSEQINAKVEKFCKDHDITEKLSHEKIWLIYYMAKKFNRIWSEGRWVKQKNISTVI